MAVFYVSGLNNGGINMADFVEKLLNYTGGNVCEKHGGEKYGGTFKTCHIIPAINIPPGT